MHNTHRLLAGLACSLLALGATTQARAQAREEAKLLVATEVLEELAGQKDQQAPDWLMQRAYGVAVVPDVTKAAFILGGRHGSGVLSIRDSQGRFSNPVFIDLTGGSVGWQIGVQETDVVLVFVTQRGIESVSKGKLTLGAGASVAAGPLGRQGEVGVGTDAEVYAYSRARGLFAGVALDGTVITINSGANGRFYGKPSPPASEIMSGVVTSKSENLQRFLAALTASTDKAIGAVRPHASTPVPAGSAPPPAPGGEPAKTFPMEDQAPGSQPTPTN